MFSTTSDKPVGIDYRVYRTHANKRVIGVLVVFFLLLMILLSRLFYLQVIQGKYYQEKAEDNRLRAVPVFAPRGIIYDSKSRILATNKLTHSLLFYPWKISPRKQSEILKKLGDYLGTPTKNLEERFAQTQPGYPIYLQHQLSTPTLARILENQSDLPGIQIMTSMGRFYPEKNLASHTIGYMGEVTVDELKQLPGNKYQPGMFIGKTGLEKNYEYLLKGIDGKKFYAISPREEEVPEIIRRNDPIPGYSLKLTLDKKLQAFAEELLLEKGYTGAIVVMDVNDGSILSLVSHPTYDLNIFSRGLTAEEWNTLQNAADHPFLNRALRAYPPGSIFKIVTAVAASEEGFLTPQRIFNSTGSFNVGGHIFHDWNRQGFGRVNIYRALANSIDTVFYELSLEMGIETIKKYADLFRLNSATGIELQHELSGQVPDKFWKQQHFNREWLPGDTVNTSIGQGYVQMTPLQAVQMVAAVANRGKLLRPHLIDSVLNERGQALKTTSTYVLSELKLTPQTWDILERGLQDAVRYGTAKALTIPGYEVAGKTGTAEVHPNKETHAWVVAYAPIHNPRYAICVFLEHAGSGGSKAAPIGQKVLNYLLNPPVEP